MNVGDICTREVVMADHRSSLQQAAVLMREHHVGALVVGEDSPQGTQAIGIVTDRDMVIEAVAKGLDLKQTEIGQLAGGKLAVVPSDMTIDEAIATMSQRGVRRLLVSSDGRLHGIVSLDDVLSALASDMSMLASTVRSEVAQESTVRTPAPAPRPKTVRIPAHLIA